MNTFFLKTTIFVLYFFCNLFIVCGQGLLSNNDCHEFLLSDFPGLNLRVFDGKSEVPLPARVVIISSDGQVIGSYYEHLPGIFTKEDGSLKIILDAGKYNVTVIHGIDYEPCEFEVQIGEEKGLEGEVHLKPWIPNKKRGWVDIAGHCHLYTDKKPNPQMARRVMQICKAQGVNAVFTAQGWSGYDDDTWKEGFSQFSDDDFRLYFSSEMPKYRTGHTWWIGQKSTYGYYDATMDTTYENQYYQVAKDEIWTFDNRIFPNVPDVEVVQRLKYMDNSLAVIAHPTSWWWQERGEIEKYTTNVPAYLSYGLLAGQIWDATVIMGYDHDHYFYQNLWFQMLNKGYRMPGLAELDGGITRNTRFYYGSMRTFVDTNGSIEEADIIESIKEGKVVVSSGSMIYLNHSDTSAIGGSFTADSTQRIFELEAFASGMTNEFLSYIILYRNGKVHQLWDLRGKNIRHFNEEIEIIESDDSWYIVKAYGKKAWDDPKYLDVMKYCTDSLVTQLPPSNGDRYDICMTNPIYFSTREIQEALPLEANVELKLLKPESGSAVESAIVYIRQNGRTVDEINVKGGKARFDLPLNATLLIRSEGFPDIRRSLFLDYKPHRDLLERLGNGRWKHEGNNKDFKSGQVPWTAFAYEQTRELLSNVKWAIILEENHRERAWNEFDAKFKVD